MVKDQQVVCSQVILSPQLLQQVHIENQNSSTSHALNHHSLQNVDTAANLVTAKTGRSASVNALHITIHALSVEFFIIMKVFVGTLSEKEPSQTQ